MRGLPVYRVLRAGVSRRERGGGMSVKATGEGGVYLGYCDDFCLIVPAWYN